jgi:hypothetical protein
MDAQQVAAGVRFQTKEELLELEILGLKARVEFLESVDAANQQWMTRMSGIVDSLAATMQSINRRD